MKLFKFLLALTFVPVATFGQAITVKSSPASDALVAAAKEQITEQKTVDTALEQARSTLDMTQKSLRTQLDAAQKELNDKLKEDKKYAPILTNIETIQKQLNASSQDAQNKFVQKIGPIQQKVASDKNLIEGLIPIVRKENDLPATATFNQENQTWVDSTKAPDKPEATKE